MRRGTGITEFISAIMKLILDGQNVSMWDKGFFNDGDAY